jgi:CheY-like chemotaxis protein
MPILDGYEATRILRQEKKVTTPIVAVTANNRNEQNEKLCFDSGMNDYVEKPIRCPPPSLLCPSCLFLSFLSSHTSFLIIYL